MKEEISGEKLEIYLTRFFNKSLSPKIKKDFDFDIKISVFDIKIDEYPESNLYTFYIDTEPYKLSDLPQVIKQFIRDEIQKFLGYLGLGWGQIDIKLNKRVLKGETGVRSIRHRWLSDIKKLPFDEKVEGDIRERIFSEHTDEMELKWHWDEEDRIVVPIHQTDWMLQMDNELPVDLLEGHEYFIPKGIYHRVIKGNGNLEVKIIFK